MRRLDRAILAMFLIAISFASIDEVHAEPLAPPSFKDSEWRASFSPYLFLPVSVTGDSTIAGQTAAFDFDTADILDLLNFGIAGRLEIWKGDFGLILDGNYIELGMDGTVSTPGPLPIDVSIDGDVRQLYIDVLGSYRLVNQPYNANGDMWSLELMGGIRYNYLKQEVDISVSGGGGPGITTRLGGSKYWVDPMLGTRVALALNERWTVGARAEIGGFGVSDTDLTWSIAGGFDYRAWETTSLKFGWRAFSIDYSSSLSDGAFGVDLFLHGPFAAVTFHFQ